MESCKLMASHMFTEVMFSEPYMCIYIYTGICDIF